MIARIANPFAASGNPIRHLFADAGNMVSRLWSLFWKQRDLSREVGILKAQLADARRRHAPTAYLEAALQAVRHEQLRATR